MLGCNSRGMRSPWLLCGEGSADLRHHASFQPFSTCRHSSWDTKPTNRLDRALRNKWQVNGVDDRIAGRSSGAETAANDAVDAGNEPGPLEEAPRAPLQPALLRKLAAAADAEEVLDMLMEAKNQGVDSVSVMHLSDVYCRAIMAAALERGNAALAQSIFDAMASSSVSVSPSMGASGAPAVPEGTSVRLRWPMATPEMAATLVVGLCRSLKTKEAVAVVRGVRSRGVPLAEDVQFGYVVAGPGLERGQTSTAGGQRQTPLAVVQPQEGVKSVADSYTKYEYELFSGTVTNVSSESLVNEGNRSNPLLMVLRQSGILKAPVVGAVHTAVVQTPGGQQRTFRFGTMTADVPAKFGDRVTVVCSPSAPKFSPRRLFLNSSPPGTVPGEPLSLSNHTTRAASVALLRPPPSTGVQGIPSWVLPAIIVVTATDAATALVDPVMPYVVAGVLAATAASTVAGTSVVLPKLKQLPERLLEVQATRQKLLAQHTVLERRMEELMAECEEDVLLLARLWQLQAKMGMVSAGASGYDARLERVVEAREAVEIRLCKRIEAVDAFARVISMIEIEVEMESELPAAELAGIEVQIARLSEIEELAEEWRLQARAADEVERLFRGAPP